MLKRLLTAMLVLISVLLFSACGAESDPTSTPEESTLPETTTEEVTEALVPAELVLADNGESDFVVVRPEKAQGYYLDAAAAVYKKFKESLSSSIKISEDWISPLDPPPEKMHELLLFATNRAESVKAMEDLDFDGYIIRVTDCKVVIVGSSPAACNKAFEMFFDNIIPDHTKNGVTALPIGYEVKEEFKATDIDIAAVLREGKTLCADFKVVFNYPKKDGFTAAQGSATDGKYAYIVMKDGSGDREVDRIVKIDMETWTVVLESETLPLDHANDMTYDPKNNQIIVTNMYDNLVSIIDAETLALVEQRKLEYGTWASGYIEESDNFVFLAYGSPSGLLIADKNFAPIRATALASAPDYVGQGMDADNRYAYVPLSPDKGKKDNIIQIYDIKTGEYLGIAHVNTTMESESMFHVGDDMYIHFNNGGSKIATLEFYVRFE